MMKTRKVVWPAIAIALIIACVHSSVRAQQASSDPRIADLVHSRKVRVGIGLGNYASATRDQSTGELKGVAMDLARAFAARIGVQLQTVLYPRPGAVFDGAKTDEWDVTFLVVDPDRTAEADASPSYMESDFTYLVPENSPIHHVSDVDHPGIRVAVPRNDAVDLRLSRMMRQAELVRVENQAAGITMLKAGQVNAYAAPRPALLSLSGQVPGGHVLDEGFANMFWAAFVPKGHPAHLAYVTDFIEDAKASGLIRQFIQRDNLHGIKVASPAKSN
jgi:polar amino acid transport system substrate-binding protein